VSDWGWVSLAYAIVYGTLLGYIVTLVLRRRRLGGGGR
jgi:hypothetical protein